MPVDGVFWCERQRIMDDGAVNDDKVGDYVNDIGDVNDDKVVQ